MDKIQLTKCIDMGLSYGLLDMALFYCHIAYNQYPDDISFKHLLSDVYTRKGCHEAILHILQHEKDMKSVALYCHACISLSKPDIAMKRLQSIVSSSSILFKMKQHEQAIYYYYYSILMNMLGHGNAKETEMAQIASSNSFAPLGPIFPYFTSPNNQRYFHNPSVFFPEPFDVLLKLQTSNIDDITNIDHPSILLAIARSYHHNGRIELAFRFYNQLYSKYPYYQDGLSEYSSLLWQLRDKSTLTGLAHRLLSRSFHSRLLSSTWVVTANAVSLHGDHSSSLKALQRASLLDPNQAYIYSLMGQEYLSLDAIPEASQCFHRAISMGPERYEAYVGLANISLRHERYKEAQILIEKALGIQPNHIQLIVFSDKTNILLQNHHK